MNIPLIIFNVIYYVVFLFVWRQTVSVTNPVGIEVFLILIIFLPLITLVILLLSNVIKIRTLVDRILGITALPLIPLLLLLFQPYPFDNTWKIVHDFTVGNKRFRSVNIGPRGSIIREREEIYRNTDTISDAVPYPESRKWIKDSTWIFFSPEGDTIKREIYRNDTLIGQYGG